MTGLRPQLSRSGIHSTSTKRTSIACRWNGSIVGRTGKSPFRSVDSDSGHSERNRRVSFAPSFQPFVDIDRVPKSGHNSFATAMV